MSNERVSTYSSPEYEDLVNSLQLMGRCCVLATGEREATKVERLQGIKIDTTDRARYGVHYLYVVHKHLPT